jgi:hypothetical protein
MPALKPKQRRLAKFCFLVASVCVFELADGNWALLIVATVLALISLLAWNSGDGAKN